MPRSWRFGRGPSGTEWAPFVLVGGGFASGALVVAIALFLKHA